MADIFWYTSRPNISERVCKIPLKVDRIRKLWAEGDHLL